MCLGDIYDRLLALVSLKLVSKIRNKRCRCVREDSFVRVGTVQCCVQILFGASFMSKRVVYVQCGAFLIGFVLVSAEFKSWLFRGIFNILYYNTY